MPALAEDAEAGSFRTQRHERRQVEPANDGVGSKAGPCVRLALGKQYTLPGHTDAQEVRRSVEVDHVRLAAQRFAERMAEPQALPEAQARHADVHVAVRRGIRASHGAEEDDKPGAARSGGELPKSLERLLLDLWSCCHVSEG